MLSAAVAVAAVAVAAAFAAAAFAAAAAAAGARAATPALDRPARIVAPRPGALITNNVVSVRVRAREPLSKLSVALSSTKKGQADVTGRFRRVRQGVWRARLRRGRHLATGPNHLYVTVRTRAGEEDVIAGDFTVAAGRADLLDVRRPRVGTRAAPVQARVALQGGRLRARLNGHNVLGAFERRGDGPVHTAQLTVHNGLRFGRNRLLVTAFTREGRYERVRRAFRVDRDRPLADAGRDRTAPAGTHLRLDGRRSRPARRGSRLALRWRVVDKPQGSKPKLRRARGARPRLVTDVNGHYTLALRARGPGAGRAGRGRGSARAPSARLAAGGQMRATTGGGASIDTVTVAAQPDALPSGLPVNTIAPNPKNPAGATGIELGSEFYPATWDFGGTGGIQLMVLDRETLAVVPQSGNPTQTFHPSDQGASDLEQALAALTSDELAIVTGGGRELDLSGDGEQTIADALASIGAKPLDAAAKASLPSGQWSLVGVPGISPGQAYQLIALRQGAGSQTGAMSGFFQIDSQVNFTFTWPPEYLTFDTHAPGSTATENVISVNGKAYPSWNLEPGQSGVQILWLEADTLEPAGTFTYLNEPVLDGRCPPPATPQCLWDFVGSPSPSDSTLQAILRDPRAMLLITTIGKPDPFASQSSWAPLAQHLPSFGANAQVMLGLNGQGDYSFVGVNGLGELGPNRGAEVSEQLAAVKSARLAGTFKRNRQGLLVPAGYGSPAPDEAATLTQTDLKKILARPDEPFPPFTSAAEQAAEKNIAQRLGLTLYPQYGIRANYWLNDSLTWGSYQTDVSNLKPKCKPDTPSCVTCDALCRQGFAPVQSQLYTEFGMVDQVQTYFTGGKQGDLNDVLLEALVEGTDTLISVSNTILHFYPPPKATPARGKSSLGILEGSATIASGFAGLVPGVGSLAAAPFIITSGVAEIMQATSTRPGGSSLFPQYVFEQEVGSFAAQLSSVMRAGIQNLSHISDLLISDWGRLQLANAKIEQGGWGLNGTSQDALQLALTVSMRRYMWSTLLPVALVVGDSGTILPGWGGYYPPQQDVEILNVPIVAGGALEIEGNYWYLCKWKAQSDRYLDEEIRELLFGSPPDGLGFQPPYLMAAAGMSSADQPLTPGFVHRHTATSQGGPWCG